MSNGIDEYRRLIDLIVSEGLDTIESQTDELQFCQTCRNAFDYGYQLGANK